MFIRFYIFGVLRLLVIVFLRFFFEKLVIDFSRVVFVGGGVVAGVEFFGGGGVGGGGVFGVGGGGGVVGVGGGGVVGILVFRKINKRNEY